MPGKRVLSVGQCGADHGSIARTLQKAFGAQVVGADTGAEALAELRKGSYALVLVNRVFDLDGSAGLDLIRKVKNEPALAGVPVMLVSNYPDAQAEAVAAGAEPGFGKASLGRAETVQRLHPLLGDNGGAPPTHQPEA